MSQLIGKKVVLTLKRSTICTVPKHRAFVQTLGLKKIGDTRE
ncbi:MAG TPA: uL30 family ribosomal protein [Geobacteraceae bacterium]